MILECSFKVKVIDQNIISDSAFTFFSASYPGICSISWDKLDTESCRWIQDGVFPDEMA